MLQKRPRSEEPQKTPYYFLPPEPTITDTRLKRAQELRKEIEALREQLAKLLSPQRDLPSE